MTSAMFDDEVPVEDHRLDLRQQGVLAIDVAPSCLDHSDFGVAEIVHNIFEEIGRGNEIGIKNGDHLAGGHLQSVLESSRFETLAVRPVNVMNVEAEGAMFCHTSRRDVDCPVRGIIENLDLQKLARIAIV